jgi:hypothetical protein
MAYPVTKLDASSGVLNALKMAPEYPVTCACVCALFISTSIRCIPSKFHLVGEGGFTTLCILLEHVLLQQRNKSFVAFATSSLFLR